MPQGNTSPEYAERELKKLVLSFKPRERFLNSKDIQEILKLGCVCSRYAVKELALQAKFKHDMKRIPLVLLLCLLPNRKNPKDKIGISNAIFEIINMPGELVQILGLYWQLRILPNSRAFLKGLAKSFERFTEEEFINYPDSGVVKLRDVMFLAHPKPRNEAQAVLFRKIANNQLKRKSGEERQSRQLELA